jgi:hypothetical protein
MLLLFVSFEVWELLAILMFSSNWFSSAWDLLEGLIVKLKLLFMMFELGNLLKVLEIVDVMHNSKNKNI